MAARGKSLAISAEQVEDILNLSYGAARTFAVLAILFPHVNTRNIHHVDHVFPQALLSRSKLKQAGFDRGAADDLQSKRDQLANLQLIEGPENIAKSDTPPALWASAAFNTPDAYEAYLGRNDLPWLPKDVTEFAAFFAERRSALGRRIAAVLGGTSRATPGIADAHTDTSEPTLRASIEEELAESAYAE